VGNTGGDQRAATHPAALPSLVSPLPEGAAEGPRGWWWRGLHSWAFVGERLPPPQ
jgi:hypothetical protein